MFQGLLRRRFLMVGLIGLSGVLTLGACQQMSTYPPVETTARFNRPAAEPVPTIVAKTVVYLRDRYNISDDVAINMPEETPPQTYDRVFARLGNGRPMMAANEPAIHITEIRTRAANAQADVMIPNSRGFYDFTTVTLEWNIMENWHVKSERRWATRGVTPPAPNYVPPAPSAAPETATAVAGE